MIMDFWPWFEFANFPWSRKKSVNVDATEWIWIHIILVRIIKYLSSENVMRIKIGQPDTIELRNSILVY